MNSYIYGSVKTQIKKIAMSKIFEPIANHYSGLGTCLTYHRVLDNPISSSDWDFYINKAIGIRQDYFDSQMCYLSTNNNCIDLDTAVTKLKRGELDKKSIIITFDDGYKDNYTLALPILEKYDVPACIYITTNFINRKANLWWYELEFYINQLDDITLTIGPHSKVFPLKDRKHKKIAVDYFSDLFLKSNLIEQNNFLQQLREQSSKPFDYDNLILTWDEVIALDKHPLITIAAHTVNHPVLSKLSLSEAKEEMQLSKYELEKRLGHEVKHFSYPFGSIQQASAREYEIANDIGFNSSFTTRPGHLYKKHSDSINSLPRHFVSYNDEIEDLMFRIRDFENLRQKKRLDTPANT